MLEDLTKVIAGDIIKSSQWNLLIDELISQDNRIKSLESAVVSGGGPIILALDPPGDVIIGAPLKIIGKNFGMPGLVAVTIQGVSQLVKQGSGDDLILLDPQGVINLPADRFCDLIVSNQKGATPIFKIKLVDPAPSTLLADLAVQPIVPPLAAPVSPGTAIFKFPIQAMTNLPATYTLTPSVTTAVPAGWSAVISDAAGNPVAATVQIPATPVGQSTLVDVRVKVTIPGGVANQTDFTVGLEIKSNTVPVQQGTRFGSFKTNVAAQPPSTDITLVIGNVIPPAAKDSGGLNVKPDATKITAHFIVNTTTFGDYEILPLSITGANAGRFTATLKNSDPKFTTDVNSKTGDVIIDLKGSAGANVDAVLVVKVAKQTDHNFFGEIDHPIHIKA
jgi:hypothetical protein